MSAGSHDYSHMCGLCRDSSLPLSTVERSKRKNKGRCRSPFGRILAGTLFIISSGFGFVLTHQLCLNWDLASCNRSVTISKSVDKLATAMNQERKEALDPLEVSSSDEMLSCLKQVLWYELPILPAQHDLKVKNGKNQMVGFHSAILAHHGDAGNWKIWNKAISVRGQPMPPLEVAPCSVWEVGANTRAESSRDYMKRYPNCQYHAFEPIPDFVQKLKKTWSGESRMHIHGYGLGDKDGSFMVAEDELAGVSTYVGDSKGGSIEAKIRNFEHALSEAGGIPTLLDVNCEGCEFDFLKQAKKHGFLEMIPIVQIGWHSYGSVGIGARSWQICEIRSQLSETHRMVQGLAFGWDRWILKKT